MRFKEGKVIVAIALVYLFFGCTQYIMTNIFIAPYLLSPFLLAAISITWLISQSLVLKKFHFALFLFTCFFIVNLLNDQWFLGLLFSYQQLQFWFSSIGYELIRVLGMLFLLSSLGLVTYQLLREKENLGWLYGVAFLFFILGFFSDIFITPNVVVYFLALVSIVVNSLIPKKESVPTDFYTNNSLWILFGVLNLFEFLSIGF
jgi:hypothetical protein